MILIFFVAKTKDSLKGEFEGIQSLHVEKQC